MAIDELSTPTNYPYLCEIFALKTEFYVLFQIHIHRSFRHVKCLLFHLASRSPVLRWNCKTLTYGRNFIKSAPKWLSQNAAGEFYLKHTHKINSRVSAKFENACEITWIYESALNCIPLLLSYFFFTAQTPHTSKGTNTRGEKIIKKFSLSRNGAQTFTAF